MQFTLIRHGQPEWRKDGLNVDNPELTETGRRQAELTARALAAETFDHLLVSPLTRSQQTAAPIAAALEMQPETLPWLAEISSPQWNDTTVDVMEIFEAARQRPPEEHWDGIEGGESFRDFQSRVSGGLQNYLQTHGVKRTHDEYPIFSDVVSELRILIIAHAGTDSVLVTNLLGVASMPWEWERFQTQHSSLTRLESISIAHGHGFSLRKLSDTAHLPNSLQTR